MTNLKKHLGQKIKTLRKLKKMTQETLAQKIGMEVKSLSRIESGYNYPQYENLLLISKALSVEPWELYYSQDSISPDKMKNEIQKALVNEKIVKSVFNYIKTLDIQSDFLTS